MIIIKKGKKEIVAALIETFPLAKQIDYRMLSGLQEESDAYDKELNQQIRKTHPFNRPDYAGVQKPSVIRWMWNPKSGEMLMDSSQMHAIMHGVYMNTLRGKGKSTADFDLWLRGFYFPGTRELAIRPFNLEALFPKSQYASEDDEAEYREAAAEFSDRMQEYLRGMLEKEIGKKFKKFHKNVDNQYLADKFRGVGGTRW